MKAIFNHLSFMSLSTERSGHQLHEGDELHDVGKSSARSLRRTLWSSSENRNPDHTSTRNLSEQGIQFSKIIKHKPNPINLVGFFCNFTSFDQNISEQSTNLQKFLIIINTIL